MKAGKTADGTERACEALNRDFVLNRPESRALHSVSIVVLLLFFETTGALHARIVDLIESLFFF